MGFSYYLPLFPSLAKHYLEVDGGNYWLNLIFDTVANLTAAGNVTDKVSAIVLFGGALGALYSLLQFIAPSWGSIIDRIGRRPVLLHQCRRARSKLSHVVFAGSFSSLSLLVLLVESWAETSQLQPVVADITDKKNRAKGMQSSVFHLP